MAGHVLVGVASGIGVALVVQLLNWRVWNGIVGPSPYALPGLGASVGVAVRVLAISLGSTVAMFLMYFLLRLLFRRWRFDDVCGFRCCPKITIASLGNREQGALPVGKELRVRELLALRRRHDESRNVDAFRTASSGYPRSVWET